MSRRRRIQPTEDWQQLSLLIDFPEQLTYEVLRPVVLFGYSPGERAKQTGVAQRTLYRQAARFAHEGMASLFAPAVEKHHTLPTAVRDLIRALKAEHPPFRANEIATICGIRLDHRPSPHTVKRILAEDPPQPAQTRRFPPYHQIDDPAEARLAIIRLHAEGWNIKSIAAYLVVDRHTVYATLRRWAAEGVLGLDDKPSAPKGPVRKTSLKTMAIVRELQRNPELGAFRIHAALQQLGIDRSPRTCGRILAHNRKVHGLRGPATTPHEPKAMPFEAVRRHQYWTVDIRYLDVHQLGGGNIYCISILENYSRAILASGLSRSQDL